MTRLIFADDSLLFLRATMKSTSTFKKFINDFTFFSGMTVNSRKSKIIFSKAHKVGRSCWVYYNSKRVDSRSNI